MSVHLVPNNALGFNRPFTQLVKKVLLISNQNAAPVAFKVKTTAPKLYCVRPNSGRIEPGDSVEVSVMLQPMKEEPPLSAKCKDKFLIQSTLITLEKETRDLQDIWNAPTGAGEEWKVYQQKLRVVYLPQDGQTVEEEDEGDFQGYDTVRNVRPEQPQPIPAWSTQVEGPSTSSPPAPPRSMTPPRVQETDSLYREQSREESLPFQRSTSGPGVGVVNVNVHQPSPPSSPPIGPAVQFNRELELKLTDAQGEIQRLRALLAAVPDPSSTAPESEAPESVAPSEFRRRYTASSDDGMSMYYSGTEVGTTVDHDGVIHQDGVPLQVVIIIALGVFITTYLFF
ncbi:VAMP-associated protein [Paxillus ammoniavirescens]|nr:VAMP-associated protein [Paxillus ammoniavirescens]